MTEAYTPEPTYCANHPSVETTLRCSKCNKPICPKCAVLTETGYKCKECVRGQQKAFETAEWFDYPLAIGVGAILSYLGSIIAGRLGFFVIFLAPVAGGIIAEVVRRIINKRRSKRLFQLSTAAVILGSLPLLLLGLLSLGVGGRLNLSLIWQAAYTFIVASTFYYRLSGIQMR